MGKEETVVERHERMARVCDEIHKLLENFTPVEAFGMLESIKHEIDKRVWETVNQMRKN